MKGAKKLNSMKMKPKSQQAKLVNQTKTKTKIPLNPNLELLEEVPIFHIE